MYIFIWVLVYSFCFCKSAISAFRVPYANVCTCNIT